MSYIGMRKTYANSSDFFSDVCSILTSCGWTLHDDISSTQKVYKSQGEAGGYAPAYIRVYNSSGYVQLFVYLYWNASTHTGSISCYNGTNGVYTQPGDCFIGCSKDFLILSSGSATPNRGGAFFPPNALHTVLTTTTGAISTGSSVSIPVSNSAGFKVGNKYQIVGQNYEGRDRLTVDSIPDSTHIVVASVPRDYASGAYLGQMPCPFGMLGTTLSQLWPLNWYNSVGTTVLGPTEWLYLGTAFADAANQWPDNTADEYILAPLVAYSYSSSRAGTWGYSKQYLFYSYASAAYMDIVGICSTKPENGTATSGGSTTLTDTSKSWTTNQWQNKWLCIVNGTGSGQSRKIASNTVTEITVSTAWLTNPDATSSYRIVDETYRHVYNGLFLLETQNALS